ncbi:MIP domain containing protein, partial [Asbolus verrucosus]
NKIRITDNLAILDRIIFFASEVCGAETLLFVGCAGCVDLNEGHYPPNPVHVGLAFGLRLMLAAQCFGHISGCHVNPMVILATFMFGNIPLIQPPLHIVGQILGAPLITPDVMSARLCPNFVHPYVSEAEAFLVEFIISFLLTMGYCGVWDRKIIVTPEAIFKQLPYTGASINPVRTLAPAVIKNNWEHH